MYDGNGLGKGTVKVVALPAMGKHVPFNWVEAAMPVAVQRYHVTVYDVGAGAPDHWPIDPMVIWVAVCPLRAGIVPVTVGGVPEIDDVVEVE